MSKRHIWTANQDSFTVTTPKSDETKRCQIAGDEQALDKVWLQHRELFLDAKSVIITMWIKLGPKVYEYCRIQVTGSELNDPSGFVKIVSGKALTVAS